MSPEQHRGFLLQKVRELDLGHDCPQPESESTSLWRVFQLCLGAGKDQDRESLGSPGWLTLEQSA